MADQLLTWQQSQSTWKFKLLLILVTGSVIMCCINLVSGWRWDPCGGEGGSWNVIHHWLSYIADTTTASSTAIEGQILTFDCFYWTPFKWQHLTQWLSECESSLKSKNPLFVKSLDVVMVIQACKGCVPHTLCPGRLHRLHIKDY